MFRIPSRKQQRRLAAVAAGTSLLAAIGIAATAGPASADDVIGVHYALTGTTFLAKLNTTVNLGPGILAGSIDLTNLTSTSTMMLPPVTVSVQAFGFTPASATVELIQNSPAADNVINGIDTSDANVTLKVTSLTILGHSVPVGDQCQTTPFIITLNAQPGFTENGGGPLAGTFTIPFFHHCGINTPLLNLTIPGPGNTINLNLGPVQFD